jgi:hypothetical protein
MFATVRTHARHNVVAYVALFFALGGTAWANHETIFSSDIVDGEVKQSDIANAAVVTDKLVQGAVTSGKVKNETLIGDDVADESLSGADLLDNSVTGADVQPLGAHDISDAAFDDDDIRDVVPFARKLFAIPTNAIESGEIENGQVTSADLADGTVTGSDLADGTVTGSDLATSAKPIAYEHEDDFTGDFGNTFPGSTEGTLALPPGTYVLFAKIMAVEFTDLGADCALEVAGTVRDTSGVSVDGFESTLALQSVDALPSGGNVKVKCDDGGDGDAHGLELKITAIQVGSMG